MTATVTQLRPATSPAPIDGILAPEVLARTGATYRQLDFWTRTGLVRVAGDQHPGSGVPRVFPRAEVDVIADVMRLVAVGFCVRPAFAIARERAAGDLHDLAPGISLILLDPSEAS